MSSNQWQCSSLQDGPHRVPRLWFSSVDLSGQKTWPICSKSLEIAPNLHVQFCIKGTVMEIENVSTIHRDMFSPESISAALLLVDGLMSALAFALANLLLVDPCKKMIMRN